MSTISAHLVFCVSTFFDAYYTPGESDYMVKQFSNIFVQVYSGVPLLNLWTGKMTKLPLFSERVGVDYRHVIGFTSDTNTNETWIDLISFYTDGNDENIEVEDAKQLLYDKPWRIIRFETVRLDVRVEDAPPPERAPRSSESTTVSIRSS